MSDQAAIPQHEIVTMHRVERFLPKECPRCRHPFECQNRDYHQLLGDIIKGEKVIRETQGYKIIICTKCDNYTAQILIDAYQLNSKEKALALTAKGYRNYQEVLASGTLATDHHEIFTRMPALDIRSVHAATNLPFLAALHDDGSDLTRYNFFCTCSSKLYYPELLTDSPLVQCPNCHAQWDTTNPLQPTYHQSLVPRVNY
jgi:hypothetical protein